MRTLLRALLAALVVASAALAVAPSASADEPTLGAIADGRDGYLQPGCQLYRVTWTVQLTKPGHPYTFQYQVIGPRGQLVGGNYYDDGGPAGRDDVRICSSEGAGRYYVHFGVREENSQAEFVDAYQARSFFTLKPRRTASVGLSGSTVTKRSGNRAVHRVTGTLRLQGKRAARERLVVQVARRSGGWARKATVRTNARGVARVTVTARWGREPMPSRLRIRVCAPATTTHLADCTTKLMRVR